MEHEENEQPEELDIVAYLEQCQSGKNNIDTVLERLDGKRLSPEKENIRFMMQKVSVTYQQIIDRCQLLRHVKVWQDELSSLAGANNLLLLRISEFVELEKVCDYMVQDDSPTTSTTQSPLPPEEGPTQAEG